MYLNPNVFYSLCHFRLTIVVTLRGAVCALIIQVVSTASERFRPGRSGKKTDQVFTFLSVKTEAFSPLWHDFLLIFPVLRMDQGSSAAMTAQALWCWRETRSVAAPQTGLTTGVHHHTGSRLGCLGTPTGFMTSWATTTAACGLTTATFTSTVDLLVGVATTGPQELVRVFISAFNTLDCCNMLDRYQRTHKMDKN